MASSSVEAIRQKVNRLLMPLSPRLATEVQYFAIMHRKLCLKSPQDFNEKIQWLKLYHQIPEIPMMADKYTARAYVRKKGLADLLIPLLGVWSDAEEIQWQSLPRAFAIKTSNASHTNIMVYDKERIDIPRITSQLNVWLRMDYGARMAEPQYSAMTPRIIAEELLDDKGKGYLTDYKVFCFHGKAKFTQVVHARGDDFNVQSQWIVDSNGESLNHFGEESDLFAKPEQYDFLISAAEILADSLPFVRVDFYIENNQLYFGEMTFTPHGGAIRHFTREVLMMMGAWIQLPKAKTIGYGR
ncbi:MAG: hypothetical protein LBN22_08315 [Clostridiales Family XIII bacterium]|nr:hypothetical protein [Clostridiales Family XIII bacterium]